MSISAEQFAVYACSELKLLDRSLISRIFTITDAINSLTDNKSVVRVTSSSSPVTDSRNVYMTCKFLNHLGYKVGVLITNDALKETINFFGNIDEFIIDEISSEYDYLIAFGKIYRGETDKLKERKNKSIIFSNTSSFVTRKNLTLLKELKLIKEDLKGYVTRVKPEGVSYKNFYSVVNWTATNIGYYYTVKNTYQLIQITKLISNKDLHINLKDVVDINALIIVLAFTNKLHNITTFVSSAKLSDTKDLTNWLFRTLAHQVR